MHPAIQKLLDHISSNAETKEYLQLATETFFGELAEQNNLTTLEDIATFLGEEAFELIYPVMLEFFFTNIYEDENGTWNMIDAFLASTDASQLTQDEHAYLRELRDSVMSLYEVTEVAPEAGVTIRDMIRGGDSFFVAEQTLTRYIAQWECLGLRVLNMGPHYEFAGGVLRLERSRAEALAPELKKMRDMIVSMYPSDDTSVPSDQVAHYAEVMWASEIGAAWMEQVVQQQKEMPTLDNIEGHPIYPVKIRFPVTGSPEKVEDALDNDEDFEPESDNKWLWLLAPEGEESEDNPAIARGYVVLEATQITLHVNSRQRANILEDRIATLTQGHTGEPAWEEPEAVEAGSAEAFTMAQDWFGNSEANDEEADDETEEISAEARDQLVLTMKDKHYRSWMKSRIPALENKTPKMARRTKKGRAQLIALLKDMENTEAHQAQQQGIRPYDMRWMWEELGLDRDAS